VPEGRIRRRLASLLRRDRRLPLGVFALAALALSIVYFANSYEHPRDLDRPRGDGVYRPILATADGHKLYLSVQSLVLDRDLDVTDEIRAFRYSGGVHTNEAGKPYFPQPIGPVLAWAPWFATGHATSKIANLFGADIPSHGYTAWHQYFTLYSSVWFAFGAALLGWLVARRWFGEGLAPLVAAMAGLFGTSLYYYAVYLPSYAHAMNAAASAGFLAYWALTFGSLRWRRFVWLGVLLGVCALVRVAGLGLGIVVAIELAARALRPVDGDPGGRAWWRFAALLVARGTVSLAVMLVVFTPQLIAWYAQTGHAITSPNGPGYVHLGRPMVPEFLWSSLNGYFASHPLAYAGAVGLLLAPRGRRVAALALLAALAVQIYVNSCVYDWWGMGSFGARRMTGCTVISIIGMASLLAAAGGWARRLPRWSRRTIGLLVIGWFVTWNVVFAHSYRHFRIEKSRPRAACCQGMPKPLTTVARPIYDVVGNPFALPASAMFAWKHGVSLQQWDTSVGAYAARPRFRDLLDRPLEVERKAFEWNIPGVNFTPWIIGGLGARSKAGGGWVRWTDAEQAEIFVPLFLPRAHRFTLSLRPNLADDDPPVRLVIAMNGETVLEQSVGADWHTLEIEVPAEHVNRGTNVLSIRAPIAPYRIEAARARRDGLPTPPREPAVGVALRSLRIHILDPAR
jgi:hypothetical protein